METLSTPNATTVEPSSMAPSSIAGLIGTAVSTTQVRNAHSRYTHRISAALATELSNYCDDAQDVTDLSAEIGILRMQVGNHLADYDRVKLQAIEHFTGDTLEAKATNQQYWLDFILDKLNASVERVREYALTMSKIQASRNGKLDFMVINQIAATLTQQVELVLSEHAGQNDKWDYVDAANRLGGFIEHEFSRLGKSNTIGGSGPVVSNVPAKESAADIVRAMAATVPYCDPQAKVDGEAQTLVDYLVKDTNKVTIPLSVAVPAVG